MRFLVCGMDYYRKSTKSSSQLILNRRGNSVNALIFKNKEEEYVMLQCLHWGAAQGFHDQWICVL